MSDDEISVSAETAKNSPYSIDYMMGADVFATDDPQLNDRTFELYAARLESKVMDECGVVRSDDGEIGYELGAPGDSTLLPKGAPADATDLLASLGKWLKYGVSGDVTAIAGDQSAHRYLVTARLDAMTLPGDFRETASTLAGDWRGPAAEANEGYLRSMGRVLDSYLGGPESHGSDRSGNYLTNAADLLEAAAGIERGFKVDLLNLARKTDKAFDALDDDDIGTGNEVLFATIAIVGLLTVAGGAALGAAVSGAVGAAMSAATSTVGGTMASESINAVRPVGGGNGFEIMASFRDALDEVIDSYTESAGTVARRMTDLRNEISATCHPDHLPEPVTWKPELTRSLADLMVPAGELSPGFEEVVEKTPPPELPK